MSKTFTLPRRSLRDVLRSRLPQPIKECLLAIYWLGYDTRDFLAEVVGWLPSNHLRCFLWRWQLQALAMLWLREIRTVVAFTLKPRYHHLGRNRDARVLALRDTLLRRRGKMGLGVERVCHLNR